MVVPFVHCKLVAPLVVDGSPTIKSSCSVGVNGFTGSGFICICSEELVLVLCEARIGGPLWLPQCLGPAPVQCSTPHAGVYFCDDPIQSW